jgi:hypothetical protein
MLFRNRQNKPSVLFSIGLLAVSAASAWRALSHASAISDSAIGFLYGVGIGIMLMGFWRKRQCRPGD